MFSGVLLSLLPYVHSQMMGSDVLLIVEASFMVIKLLT